MGFRKLALWFDLLEWVSKLALYKPFMALGKSVPCPYPFLDLRIFSESERWKEKVPKFAPNF